MLQPHKIIIHHSATEDGRTFSWHAIHHYHTNVLGWSDIGYHAGIELFQDKYLCLFGRPDVVPGAHTRGFNADSLGFCFVGNFDEVEPQRSRLRCAARRVLVPWLLRHGLGVDTLVPHRNFSNKTCPGKLFDMDLLRHICAEEMDAVRE